MLFHCILNKQVFELHTYKKGEMEGVYIYCLLWCLFLTPLLSGSHVNLFLVYRDLGCVTLVPHNLVSKPSLLGPRMPPIRV